jgi:hypothetical protein
MSKSLYELKYSFEAPDLLKSKQVGKPIFKYFEKGYVVFGEPFQKTSIILEKRYVFPLEYLEKTDKCKIGYVSEVKSNAKLNEISIKNISGGDPFDLRPLYNTNRTMTATCCLWLLANTLPKFTVEKSMNKRIQLI